MGEGLGSAEEVNAPMSLAAALVAIVLGAPAGDRFDRAQRAFNDGDIDGALRALDLAAVDEVEPTRLENLPLFFRSLGVGFGFGAAGGVEVQLLSWLDGFVQLGGQHLLINENRADNTTFTTSAGLRLRVP